eukprot:2702326-Pleurochrysis_carterae.AAC.5
MSASSKCWLLRCAHRFCAHAHTSEIGMVALGNNRNSNPLPTLVAKGQRRRQGNAQVEHPRLVAATRNVSIYAAEAEGANVHTEQRARAQAAFRPCPSSATSGPACDCSRAGCLFA